VLYLFRSMDEKFMAQRVKEESRDGEISCAAALSVAKELGVPPPVVGEEANRLGIKIRSCQLGCF